MNIADKIKAAQIERSEQEGKQNPYADLSGYTPKKVNNNESIIDKMKGIKPEDNARKLPTPTGDLEHYQSAMTVDLNTIKKESTLEAKAKVKSLLIKNYTEFVNSYIENGHDYPNSIAVQVMIWAFDIGDIDYAHKLGLYLITTKNQAMPPKFDRTIEVFFLDALYDWANAQLKAGHSAEPYLLGSTIIMLRDGWAAPDAVYTKIFVMNAKHLFAREQYQDALDFCNKAKAIAGDKAGVKGLVEKLESALEKDK